MEIKLMLQSATKHFEEPINIKIDGIYKRKELYEYVFLTNLSVRNEEPNDVKNKITSIFFDQHLGQIYCLDVTADYVSGFYSVRFVQTCDCYLPELIECDYSADCLSELIECNYSAD